MKNDSNKIQDEKALTREERAERRKQREQLSRQRRADRIEQAKRTLQEESRPYFIERAKQILIEEELAERIDRLRQKQKDVRVKHRAKLREIRKKEGVRHPISEKGRAKRSERAQRVSSHKLKTYAIINRIIEELVGKEGSEVFDMFPFEKALSVSPISYGQIADMLNDKKHKTLYGKRWSRASVKRIFELHGGRKYNKIGHKKDRQQAANVKREKKADIFAIEMWDKESLLKDTTQTPHEIARELNRRGVRTSSKNEDSKWVNVSVKRLLDRIDELEHAVKVKDEVLPLIDLTQAPREIARELNRRGVKISSKKKDVKWEKKSVEKLLRRIEWLKE